MSNAAPATASVVELSDARRIHARRRMLGMENEFVICNPTPDAYKIPWGGETLFVPPRHKATAPHRFPDVRHSYEDAPGHYLQGTLVIRDLKEYGDLGQENVRWSATACVRTKIGLDFEAEFGVRGLFWLPADFDMDEFEALSAAGFVRWQESKLDDARRIVHEVETQIAVHREKNMAPPLPPPSYDEAKAMLVAAAEKMQIAYSEIMVSRGATVARDAEEAASFREARESMGLRALEPEYVAAATSAPAPVPPPPTIDREALKKELMAELREAMMEEMTNPAPKPYAPSEDLTGEPAGGPDAPTQLPDPTKKEKGR